ncbi:MAG: hypothetical protein E6Q33_04410 [Neisseriales bacterium]|nr:MAG: hypothetical protein E6Q33_04410 [Neisseriales bacterium]
MEVTCWDGTIYECENIVISIPLGVLKKKCVKFIPELPPRYQEAIDNLEFATMNKIALSFEKRFWGNSNWITFGHDEN